jgi:DNA/RNA endonuclease G (NUC1)
MKKYYVLFLMLLALSCTAQENIIEKRECCEDITVETPIFTVYYSESKQQPITLTYLSSNRPKNVDRGSMNFRTEKNYYTSDNNDYKGIPYDKGHLAPAATFSDSYENLRATFSFLNCALQKDKLNRGAWRLLEQEERIWDDEQDLEVTINVIFSDSIMANGATLPLGFEKHIKFLEDNSTKCFYFPNEDPIKSWEEYEVSCNN